MWHYYYYHHFLFPVQYQYMPFLLGVTALLYYIPYMLHKLVNHDIVRLKDQVDKPEPDVAAIYRVYFKQTRGRPVDQRPVMYRQLMVLVVKFLYLVVNVGTFLAFDSTMNGFFMGFGSKWFDWIQLENTERFDYMGGSNYPKPGKSQRK